MRVLGSALIQYELLKEGREAKQVNISGKGPRRTQDTQMLVKEVVTLGTEARVSCLLGKFSTTKLHPQPSFLFF